MQERKGIESNLSARSGATWTPEDIELLIKECSGILYKGCNEILNNPGDVLLALQATLEIAYRRRASYTPEKTDDDNVCGWLLTIAIRECWRILRRRNPPVLNITSDNHAFATVSQPFFFKLLVMPRWAVFGATGLPPWLDLISNPKSSKPTTKLSTRRSSPKPASQRARQALSGTPIQPGEFRFTLMAERLDLDVRTTLRFTLFVLGSDDGDRKPSPPSKLPGEGIVWSTSELYEEPHAPHDYNPDGPPTPLSPFEEIAKKEADAEVAAELERRFARLSAKERRAVEMKEFENESHATIAKSLSTTIGYSRRLLNIALNKMR